MNVTRLGDFIRDRRTGARLSLRKLSGLAGVSIPYLSQVERGLRKPSAEILQAIAKALRVSAETLYVQAGILEDRPAPDVSAAIVADPTITERQKQALLQIYEAFRDETGWVAETPTPPERTAPVRQGRRTNAASTAATKRTARRTLSHDREQPGGRTKARAKRRPVPPPSVLPPRTKRKEV